MPVRVKQRAIVAEKETGSIKDREKLRRDIIAMLLPWPQVVAVTIRDFQTNHKIAIRPSYMPFQSGNVSVGSVCSLLAQASFISQDQRTNWVAVHASTPRLVIGGTISLEPCATKQVQFLSLGIHPIMSTDGQSIFHDEINRLFSNSAFGVEEEAGEINAAEKNRTAKDGRYKRDGYTAKELKCVKKGVDRWPMFVINIQISDAEKLISGVEGILDEKKHTVTSILELLRVLVLEFLDKNHFRPKATRRHQSKKTSQLAHPAHTGNASISSGSSKQNDGKTVGSSSRITHGSNVLATNLRLPSFRQGVSLANSPFDSWSRVKKGAVSKPTTPKILVQDLGASEIPRAATAPPALSGIASSKSGTICRQNAKPLLAKDGKLLRAPFDDVTLQAKPKPAHILPTQPVVPAPGQASDDADELVAWINPMTKVQTLVNKRTGLTMKANNNSSSYSSQAPRLTTTLSMQKPSQVIPSPWISDLLRTWDNPVFAPAEASIPQISYDGADARTQNILHGHEHHCSNIDIDRASKEVSSGINGRISKDALKQAEIISQVDQKFVLVKLQSTQASTSQLEFGSASMLVLIDQHAADERIRVEGLMTELCTPPRPDSTESYHSGIMTTSLVKPLHFDLSTKEDQLLQDHQQHFSNWGILYTTSGSGPASKAPRLTVHSLPPSILERCQSSPRLLIDLIRTEAWKVHDKSNPPTQLLPQGDWLQRIHTCPQGILDMISSRACRSAIMFNDVLSKEQCEMLVRKLADCKFPFQCAHGRPSLVPLVDIGALNLNNVFQRQERELGFGERFRRWEESLV